MYFNSHAHSLKIEISTHYSNISSNPRKGHAHNSLGTPQYWKYTAKDLLSYLVIAVTPYRYVHIPTMAHDGKNFFISGLIAGHSYLLVFQHCPSSSITSFFCHKIGSPLSLALQKNSPTHSTLNLAFLNRTDQQCTIVSILIFPTGNATM